MTNIAPADLPAIIRANWPSPAWSDLRVAIAVSGGADSVALARALVAVRPAGLLVLHFNHALRGAESDADEQFVRHLADRLDLQCIIGRAEPEYIDRAKGSSLFEEQCRHWRYEFFRQAAATAGARYLAMGHTADDQAETILHRILRGTGLRGLGGIPAVRLLTEATTIVRPMLTVTRSQVLAYLDSLGQDFRTDSSNALLHGTRNRIRHELLPQLAVQYNASVKSALLNLGQVAGEAQAVIDQFVEPLLTSAMVEVRGGACELDCARLMQESRYLVRECLAQLWRQQGWPEQAMGHAQWQSLTDLALAPAHGETRSAQVFSGAIRASRHGMRLRLERLKQPAGLGDPPDAE